VVPAAEDYVMPAELREEGNFMIREAIEIDTSR
jgi:hypothetical protein